MLLSSSAIGVVAEIIGGGDFYRDSHGTVYKAALALWGKGEPVDAITLADELDTRGELERVGGRARIAELAALVPAASNAEHYARIVKEMATLRGLVRVGQEITRLGQDRPGETADLVDRAEQIRLRSRAAARHRRLRPHRGSAQGELRADHAALRGGRRHHRRPLRLPRARQAHLRLPAGEPDHPRGPPVDGEVGARALHRREPRRALRDPGGALHARDVRSPK